MNRLRVIIFQLVVSVAVFGQNYKSIAFDDSSFALKDSIEKEVSFSETIAIINRLCSSDIQKLCLVAGWFYDNMNFDLVKFQHGGNQNNVETILEIKKGTCNDYAVLFSEFCNQLAIKNEIIEGYVPEYNSKNTSYYETNHAWNVVKIEEEWYHCDLLGFSGFLQLRKSGEYQFIKKPTPKRFLTQDLQFISKHIPADPIWQFSNYPIPLDSLIKNGELSVTDSTQHFFDFTTKIERYSNLTHTDKKLMFADHANAYNPKNSNVIVVNYFNAAVVLINNWNNDKKKLVKAKSYLEKAREHVSNAKNGVEVLKTEIEKGLELVNFYLS